MRTCIKWLFCDMHSRFIDSIFQNEKNWKVQLLQDYLEYAGLLCLLGNFKIFFQLLWKGVLFYVVCVLVTKIQMIQTASYSVKDLEHTYISEMITTEDLMGFILVTSKHSLCLCKLSASNLRFEKRDHTFKDSFSETCIKLKKLISTPYKWHKWSEYAN